VADVTQEMHSDAVEVTAGGGAAANGHALARRNGHKQIPPLDSLAMAASADLGRLLADSDKQTLAILELRRRAAAAKRRGCLVGRMLLLADVIGLVLAFVLAAVLAGGPSASGKLPALSELAVFAATLPIWAIAAKVYGLYDNDDERTDHTTADDLVGVFHLVTVGTWGLLVATTIVGVADPDLGRLIAFWAVATATIATTRCCARVYCRRRITYLQNVVIVGAGEVGQFIARKLLQHTEYGVNLLGFVDSDPKAIRAELERVRVLGRPEDLPAIVRLFDVERVIFAFARWRSSSRR
jgi:FlaA1/EpsC-like NDP-sugar epimerase